MEQDAEAVVHKPPEAGHPLHRAWASVGEPTAERFNGRVRDELLNCSTLKSSAPLLEGEVGAEAWRIEYNTIDDAPPERPVGPDSSH